MVLWPWGDRRNVKPRITNFFQPGFTAFFLWKFKIPQNDLTIAPTTDKLNGLGVLFSGGVGFQMQRLAPCFATRAGFMRIRECFQSVSFKQINVATVHARDEITTAQPNGGQKYCFCFCGGYLVSVSEFERGRKKSAVVMVFTDIHREREKEKRKVVSYGTFKKVIPTTCAASMFDRCSKQWSTIKTNTINNMQHVRFVPRCIFSISWYGQSRSKNACDEHLP